MFKPTHCAWLVAAACALPSYAMNIQPDPQNAGGYVIAAPDLAAVEKTKTANPMYGIWAKALATRSNTIVDAIKPRAASNPDNVKRVERVFTESDWDCLLYTSDAADEHIVV